MIILDIIETSSSRKNCEVLLLLAAQRSGTHLLGSILNSHPAICSLDEVLNPNPKAAEVLPLRYHLYLKERMQKNPEDCTPLHGKAMFHDYVDRIEDSYPDQRHILLDIKYDQLHQIPVETHELQAPPPVLKIFFNRKTKIIHMVRRNILKAVVSMYTAHASQRFAAYSEAEKHESKISIDTITLLRDLEQRRDSVARASSLLQRRSDRTLSLYYEDLCDPAPDGNLVSPESVRQIAQFLDLENRFSLKPHIVKQGSNQLADMIENWEEVRSALCGTEFEAFLDSDNHSVPAASTAPASSVSWRSRLAALVNP